VGTVSRAYRDFSWVRLITDPDSAVNARVNVQALQPQPAASPQPLVPETPPAATTTPAIAGPITRARL